MVILPITGIRFGTSNVVVGLIIVKEMWINIDRLRIDFVCLLEFFDGYSCNCKAIKTTETRTSFKAIIEI